MESKKKAVILLAISVLLLFVILACASQQVAPEAQQPASATAQKEVVTPPPPSEPPTPKSPYEVDIKPLTPDECARCHYAVYNQIKEEGGKHKIDCVQCHTKYHAYNPAKQNWAEIMPKCQTCHGNIHGEKFIACGSCHSNPHAPKTQMAMTAEFAKVCGDCHAKVAQEIQSKPSKHTKVQCAQCHHQKHGYIPACAQCHKPHAPVTDKECLACHPVHSPINIGYPATTANSICGGCHGQIQQKLEASSGKHRMVPCAQCHTKHKYLPKCEECHGKPHGEGLLKKFPQCSQCHADVHDLPALSNK